MRELRGDGVPSANRTGRGNAATTKRVHAPARKIPALGERMVKSIPRASESADQVQRDPALL